MKIAFADLVDGRLILPPEALACLPAAGRLFVLVDSDKGTLTVHAVDPRAKPDEALMQSLDALNEGLTLDEYTKPLSPDELRRPRAPSEGDDR